MIDLLTAFGYQPPEFKEWQHGDLEIVRVPADPNYMVIQHSGQRWMAYNQRTHEEAAEFFSHYFLARGHVICTGLGFAVRERWLLTRPEVTKLTVIESNADLIRYHRENDSAWIKDPRVEIINADADQYCASCDVLLADHFEGDKFDHTLHSMRILQNNISCEYLWFWPLERIIMHCRKWHSDNDEPKTLLTKLQAYEIIRRNHNLYRLPDLSESRLNMFCMMFHSKLFSRSEEILTQTFADRHVFHDVYRLI